MIALMEIGGGTLVLFDLDGVLVDSRGAISGCINHALKVQGLEERPRESLLRFIGPPLALAFAQLVGEPRDSELVQGCVASYRARYEQVSIDQTVVIAEIPEILAALSKKHRLAIATSKPWAFAEPILAHTGLRPNFELIAAPDLNAHMEDKTTTIRRALATLQAARAVMVGDRSFDVVAAHACTIPAIGVLWGIGSRKELTDAGADEIIDTPSGLFQAIDRLLQ